VFKLGIEGDLESNRAPALASSGEPVKTYLWRDPMQGHPTAAAYLPPAIARSPNEPPFPNQINATWQAALPAPWSNYRLVVTQWTDTSGNPRPQNADGISIAKNSTLETYLIGDQTISLQVPGIDTTDACPKPDDGSTLWAEIEQILAYRGYPKTGRTTTTWSSCYMCHQIALYKYGEDDEDVIQTDYSFVYKSVLPVIPCVSSKF
jgi:hypothetical protein